MNTDNTDNTDFDRSPLIARLNLLKNDFQRVLSPYSPPEIVNDVEETQKMIDDYIANPSEALLAKVFLKYLCM